MEWMNQAKCRKTTEVDFFSIYSEDIKSAKQFCQTCTVQNSCLSYALSNNISHGVWGGKTPRERRKIIISQSS